VILADEPVASLDPKTARSVLQYLRDATRELGIAVVCNLHQVDYAREFGDRIVGLSQGAWCLTAYRPCWTRLRSTPSTAASRSARMPPQRSHTVHAPTGPWLPAAPSGHQRRRSAMNSQTLKHHATAGNGRPAARKHWRLAGLCRAGLAIGWVLHWSAGARR
jgi:ABC-type glutathione transport system ATPase component